MSSKKWFIRKNQACYFKLIRRICIDFTCHMIAINMMLPFILGKESTTQKVFNESFNQGWIYSHCNYTNGCFSKLLLQLFLYSSVHVQLFSFLFTFFGNILYRVISQSYLVSRIFQIFVFLISYLLTVITLFFPLNQLFQKLR